MGRMVSCAPKSAHSKERRAHLALIAVVFTFRSHYWLWCPVIAPIVGALGASYIPSLGVGPPSDRVRCLSVGVFLYDACIFTGAESILNKPCVSSSTPVSESKRLTERTLQ